jgi:cyclomaltodextrinase
LACGRSGLPEDLGINAIYFNPIFQAASNHRYNTHDYYHVDRFWGQSSFYTTMAEGHKRNIRVVLDGVFNHVGRGFYHLIILRGWTQIAVY